VEKLTVAAQPVGDTETPAGAFVVVVNAVAGQLPVAPVMPMTIGHPLAGTGPQVPAAACVDGENVAEAVGKAIAAVVVSVFVVGVEFVAEVGPTTVTTIVRV
jgi:hypothetical protein